jgi:hypothetical protein
MVLLTFDPSHRPWLTDYLPERGIPPAKAAWTGGGGSRILALSVAR